eukprot:jgi/Chlat1/3152/Chrsp21S03369
MPAAMASAAVASSSALLARGLGKARVDASSDGHHCRHRKAGGAGRRHSAPASASLDTTAHTNADEKKQALQLQAKLAELKRENEALKAAAAAAEAAARSQDVSASTSTQQTFTAPQVEKPSRVVTEPEEIEWPSPTDEVPFWQRLESSAVADACALLDIQRDQDPMHIVHVSAEMAPVAKVGGLGDVVTGLARSCLKKGHRVEVMLPYYDCLDTNSQQIDGVTQVEAYQSFHKGQWVKVDVFTARICAVPVLLLRPDNQFFKGSRIYGGSYNEMEAYLFFSRACLEYLLVSGRQPDIIHSHEWHTAALGLLYWDMYHSLGLQKPRLLLTIHNMEHYGECREEELAVTGLNAPSYFEDDKALDDRTKGHNPPRISLLKGGIVYSNAVTTVSPTYAEETLRSGWISQTLQKYRQKYHGVLNGIDTVTWDPSTDAYLPAQYTADDVSPKKICKVYIQKGLGLDPDTDMPIPGLDVPKDAPRRRTPLIACITRLVPQKGIHLIRHAIYRTLEQGGQFVLVGSAPDPAINRDFQGLAQQFKDHPQISILLTYSESLAHLVYAGADCLLVPSMFEPCGLTQMIAMRYGTVPIVRRTGGLADTVFDVDDESRKDFGNGFLFSGADEKSESQALDRAIQYYKMRPEWWQALQSSVMRVDYSWERCGQTYIDLYRSLRH